MLKRTEMNKSLTCEDQKQATIILFRCRSVLL